MVSLGFVVVVTERTENAELLDTDPESVTNLLPTAEEKSDAHDPDARMIFPVPLSPATNDILPVAVIVIAFFRFIVIVSAPAVAVNFIFVFVIELLIIVLVAVIY
jgi:hypothetical protein